MLTSTLCEASSPCTPLHDGPVFPECAFVWVPGDGTQQCMHASRVRHEAGEALGAIGGAQCLQLLEDHQADPCLEVAQTCQLALQRIQHYSTASSGAPLLQPSAPCEAPAACCAARPNGGSGGSLAACEPAATAARTGASLADSSCAHAAEAVCQANGRETTALCACHEGAAPQRCQQHGNKAPLPEPEEASPYLSVDPAPAAPLSTPTPALRALLLDESAPIFERYRCAGACLPPTIPQS